jgi:hypothetical protein
MTDTQLLLSVVVLLYITGRCWWLPKGTVAFKSTFFGEYRPLTGSSYLGNCRGSVFFADPFIPLRPLYLADSANAFSSSEVTASPPGARRLHPEINTLHQQSLQHCGEEHCREEIRKQMRQRFNVREARKRVRKSIVVLEPLRLNCNVWLLTISTFYILIAVRFGLQAATLPLLIWLEIAAIHLGITFYCSHAILFPAERRSRMMDLVKFILCPPTVFRCVDTISSDLLTDFDPIVVAYLVCRRRQFEKFCNRSLRLLRFSSQCRVPRQQEWFMSEFEDSFRHFLKAIGMTADECMPAPAPLDSFSKSYCPRCEAQYVFGDGFCSECNLPVLSFAEAITENSV